MYKRILIIHPEGNINNNPNLTGLVEILTEGGCLVDIKSPRLNIYQNSPCKGASLIYEKVNFHRSKVGLIDIIGSYKLLFWLFRLFKKIDNKYDLIIGVDRYGIIEASIIGRLMKVPYGFIPYEIFFAEETSKRFKKIEKEACRGISFAITQDRLRKYHLSRENEIPSEKIFCIPVAGRFAFKGPKEFNLHDKLGIDRNKKIALFIGSVARWTMINELIESLQYWPENWVLVLHDRYSIRNAKLFHKNKLNNKLFISNIEIPDVRMMRVILHSADIGIAFYKPDFSGPYTGNNLKYLGLSSGKISTYLQHGLPVLINELGEISDFVKSLRLGFVVEKPTDIPAVLSNFDRNHYSERCIEFFLKRLDLNLFSNKIIELIKTCN